MEEILTTYLHKNIPISQSMGIRVEHASTDKVVLFAPIRNNINHKKTVFGGSLHAVATLACWSLLYLNLQEAGGPHAQIVIAESKADFLAPVEGDFKAECRSASIETWHQFSRHLHKKGKARITLEARIFYKERLAFTYSGIFVALQSTLNKERDL